MTFSVLIPTYNRRALLEKTLESLFHQDFRDFEIIVVSDGSTDDTHEFLTELAAASKIRYYHHENRGLAATRLAGVQQARGEFIAFTDDDCVIPSDWLSRFHQEFKRHNVAGIGGASRTGNPSNSYATVNDMINNFFKAAINRDGVTVPYFTGNNVVYARTILEKVGGPDKRFRMGAEDRDLTYRIAKAGGTFFYDSSNVVDHYNDADFFGFLGHQYDQGKGSFLFYTVHGNSGSGPQRIPFHSYVGLLLYPFQCYPVLRALWFSFLIVLAQFAVTMGYLAAFLSRSASMKTCFV